MARLDLSFISFLYLTFLLELIEDRILQAILLNVAINEFYYTFSEMFLGKWQGITIRYENITKTCLNAISEVTCDLTHSCSDLPPPGARSVLFLLTLS